MKAKFVPALIVVFILCITSQALALSDNEYGRMMRDDNFLEADRNLNSAWAEAKDSMTAADFAKLKKSQTQWIKTGRDKDAQRLMKSQGLSKTEAYAQATNDRAEYIRSLIQDATSDPYSDFEASLKNIADKIMRGKPTFTDGSSRIWKGRGYVIAKSGQYLSKFYTVDPSMTFAGGLRIGSRDSDVRRFFGDSLSKNNDGTYYSGGVHQWTEFDTRGGRLTTINFTQSDAYLTDKAEQVFSNYVSSLQD